MLKKISDCLFSKPAKKRKEDHPFVPQVVLNTEHKIDLAFWYLFWYLIIPSMFLLACFVTFNTSRRILLDMYHSIFG
jgi:hypothetical protein